ncbi:secondary thiamine-phosphate synthase enzyme YjbQ [Paracoccus onubensis]|uniref:YjbQ family protein n=1 Tax=Paracoccus onubensis TaxID=1675788 RepID=A0A418SSB8_9RHOB|nr:secondary thiamine-phosphate synthase enzyme YjbQ [Paracoccus onubensis]RJE83809.1 YjbQ family protein [Paracoccus onubensis]
MNRLLSIRTNGPVCHEFTNDLQSWLDEMAVGDGVLTLMIRHTSCSLLIQENADPDVQRDLLAWLNRIAPPADDPSMGWITHRYEGPDDMPAHLKAAILPVSLQIPVQQGRMMLGQWQGIYLVEHRDAPHCRQIAAIFQPS